MYLIVSIFITYMSQSVVKSTVAAIRKLEREGVAPNGVSLMKMSQRENVFCVRFQGKQKSPEGKTVLYVGSKDDPRYIDWAARVDRRNKLKQLKRALKAMGVVASATEAAGLKKEKPSVEWYTPPEFVEMARQILGCIDLDPASNPIAQKWIKAKKYYTKDNDGLAQQWKGNVWCNPPYGQWTKKFLTKGLEEYRAGRVKQAIFLVNRTGAAWYQDLIEEFDTTCQVRKRISFYTPEGKPEGSPRYYNDFLYLGRDTLPFMLLFEEVGRIKC
jgi:hypothetical protein